MENIDYEGLVKALKARRFLPEVFDTAAEAKAAEAAIIEEIKKEAAHE